MPTKTKTIKWREISPIEFRAFPDRQHLLLVRKELTADTNNWHWYICLGHERNVLEQGETDSSVFGEKNAMQTAGDAYIKLVSR